MKKFILTTIAIVLCFSTVACSNNASDNDSETSNSSVADNISVTVESSQPDENSQDDESSQPDENSQSDESSQSDENTQPDQSSSGIKILPPDESLQPDENIEYITLNSLFGWCEGETDPGSPYACSCKVPREHNVADGNVVIFFGYGCPNHNAYFPYCDYVNSAEFVIDVNEYKKVPADDNSRYIYQKERTTTIKRIDLLDLQKPEYNVEETRYDENGYTTVDVTFAHTDAILLPLSIFSEEEAYIDISIYECINNATEFGFDSDVVIGEGTGIGFYYKRTDTKIIFSATESPYENAEYITLNSFDLKEESLPIGPFINSCKIATQHNANSAVIPISLSYGMMETDNSGETQIVAENKETVVLKTLTIEELSAPEYAVELHFDQGYIASCDYSHTETFYLPIELFSGDSGAVSITWDVQYTGNDHCSGVPMFFYYERIDNKIIIIGAGF